MVEVHNGGDSAPKKKRVIICPENQEAWVGEADVPAFVGELWESVSVCTSVVLCVVCPSVSVELRVREYDHSTCGAQVCS